MPRRTRPRGNGQAMRVRIRGVRTRLLDRHPLCRKKRFKDERAALDRIAGIKARPASDRTKIPQRAYSCPLCGGWHLTSNPERKDREA